MLGPVARQYLFQGFKMGAVLYHIPFDWDKQQNKAYYSDTKIRKVVMYDNLCHGIFGVVYCSVMTAYMFYLKEDNPEYLPFYMIGMVMTGSLLLPLALQYNTVRTGDELLRFANNFVEFGEYFQDTYVFPDENKRQSSKKQDVSGMFIGSLYYLGIVIVLLIGLIIFLNPRMPLLLTGNFDFWHWTFYWSFHIIQSVGITAHCFTWFGNQFVHAFPAIEYLFGIFYMLNEMKLRRDRYTTFDNLRRPTDFVQTYRALQILNAKAMYLNSSIVLPVNQWVYLFVASYCIYGALKLEGLYAAVMVVSAFIMLYYLAVVFTIFAKIHDTSEELLHSWRKEEQTPWIRKTLMSFKPISIWIGTYYYCDQPMVLSMFQSILEGTVDLLMLG